MAGQSVVNGYLQGVKGTPTALVGAVPAGKAESVCVCASITSGTVDEAINVILTDPVVAPSGIPIIYQEPVRYRQPGGSPVLLQNFILPAGASLSVAETTGSTFGIDVIVYNRWRFDAVAGQNMPFALINVAPATSAAIIPVVPAGLCEQLCVLAFLPAGTTADTYADLFYQTGAAVPMIAQSEPVRYRQPGGNPVMALDFIVSAGSTVNGRILSPSTACNFLAYNRWRFNA